MVGDCNGAGKYGPSVGQAVVYEEAADAVVGAPVKGKTGVPLYATKLLVLGEAVASWVLPNARTLAYAPAGKAGMLPHHTG